MLIMIPGVTASNFSQLACSFIKMCQMESRAVRIKNILHADQRKTLGMIFFIIIQYKYCPPNMRAPDRRLAVVSRTISPVTALR